MGDAKGGTQVLWPGNAKTKLNNNNNYSFVITDLVLNFDHTFDI